MMNERRQSAGILQKSMGYDNPRSLYPVLKSAKGKLKKAKAASASREGADPATPSVRKPTGAPRKRKTASEKASAPTPTKGAKRGKKVPTTRLQGLRRKPCQISWLDQTMVD